MFAPEGVLLRCSLLGCLFLGRLLLGCAVCLYGLCGKAKIRFLVLASFKIVGFAL